MPKSNDAAGCGASKAPSDANNSSLFKNPLSDLEAHINDAIDLLRIIMMAAEALEGSAQDAVRTTAREGVLKLDAANAELENELASRREARR